MSVNERSIEEPAQGFRQEVRFFADGIFGSRTLPLDIPIRGGVVICPPLFMDVHRTARLEVLLARELAARGLAVQRFCYRGTGFSGGDDRDLALDRMLQDAQIATNALRDACAIDNVAF